MRRKTQNQNEDVESSAPHSISTKLIRIDPVVIIHYFVNTEKEEEVRRPYYLEFKRRIHHFEPLFDAVRSHGSTRPNTAENV